MNIKFMGVLFLAGVCLNSFATDGIKNSGKVGSITNEKGSSYILSGIGREGEVKSVSVELVKVVSTRGSSVRAVYDFNVGECGTLKFIQGAGQKYALLSPDDQVSADAESACPIFFGATESWLIK
ncbi:hypothetical protein [Pseudomonas capeferrum]